MMMKMMMTKIIKMMTMMRGVCENRKGGGSDYCKNARLCLARSWFESCPERVFSAKVERTPGRFRGVRGKKKRSVRGVQKKCKAAHL